MHTGTGTTIGLQFLNSLEALIVPAQNNSWGGILLCNGWSQTRRMTCPMSTAQAQHGLPACGADCTLLQETSWSLLATRVSNAVAGSWPHHHQQSRHPPLCRRMQHTWLHSKATKHSHTSHDTSHFKRHLTPVPAAAPPAAVPAAEWGQPSLPPPHTRCCPQAAAGGCAAAGALPGQGASW